MRKRRAVVVFIVGTIILALLGGAMPQLIDESLPKNEPSQSQVLTKGAALEALEKIPVKGRAAKTGYARAQFGDGWAMVQGCSTRNIILNRDMRDVQVDEKCVVTSGVLDDPYTGEVIHFSKERSSEVQIDHVIALSDAWQKGAQQLTREERIKLANDPLELLAVSGPQNQAKGDGDAATWLPKNKAFRCEYIARQIAIKIKYSLWVTQPEKDAMQGVLKSCPDQPLP